MNDVRIIVDIGAKDSNYPIEYPEATCHLFEPNPNHAKELKTKYHNWPVVINEWAIGDKEENKPYDPFTESFVVGTYQDKTFPVKTLDSYLELHNINKIDLLKVDTEGMDLIILKGNPKAVGMSRYIIFESWNNLGEFEEYMKDMFYMVDIKDRNVLCKRKQ